MQKIYEELICNLLYLISIKNIRTMLMVLSNNNVIERCDWILISVFNFLEIITIQNVNEMRYFFYSCH